MFREFAADQREECGWVGDEGSGGGDPSGGNVFVDVAAGLADVG